MTGNEQNKRRCKIHYLGHSAWLLEDEDQACLFDYGRLPVRDQELVLDKLGRASLFFSHLHQDHWHEGLARQALAQGAKVFLGLDDPADRPAGLNGLITMQARTSYVDDQIAVQASGSTDQGVSFLIRQGGLTFYHGGDLAIWDDTDHYRESYRQEVDWLAAQLEAGQAPQLAFLPVATSDGYQEGPLLEGIDYFLDKIRPRYILPMHAHAHEHLYSSFAAWLARRPEGPALLKADRPGLVFALDLKDHMQDQT